MSYVAPTTRASGYLAGTAVWNQDVVDNIIAIHDSPAARVYHSTTQTVPSGSSTALAFDSETFDNASIHDTVTNNSRLTAPVAGVYLITGTIYGTHNAGRYTIFIRENGGVLIAGNEVYNPTAGSGIGLVVATLYKLAAAEYVELEVFQDSGTNFTVAQNDEYSPFFSIQWLGEGV